MTRLGPKTQIEKFVRLLQPTILSSSTDIRMFPSNNHQTETSIAINPYNLNNLLTGANTDLGQGYYYSLDDAISWSGGDTLPGVGDTSSDPAVGFDANGNAYFNYLESFDGGFTYRLFVKKSTNGGANWSNAVEILNAGDPDKNHMTVDVTTSAYRNYIYVAYTDFTPYPNPESPIKFSRSTNNGTSFSTPVDISGEVTSYFSQGANLAVGPNGELFATWAIYDDWGSGVYGEDAISAEGAYQALPLPVAWHETSGTGPYQNTIIYRKSITYNDWSSNQYTRIYYQEQQRPTITALASNKIDIIYQTKIWDAIYKQHYNGSYWSGPTYIGGGQYPSVSTGNTQAEYVWTSAGSAPYTISISSETLSKEGESGEPHYERAISWLDSSGAHITVRVKGWSIKTVSGQQQSLSFLPVSLDTVADFIPENAWEHLATLPSFLPAEAESLVVDFTLWAENLQKLGARANPNVSVEFQNAARQLLSKVAGPAFVSTGNIPETPFRLAVELNTVKQRIGTNTFTVAVKVEGFSPKSEVFASLGHIYDFNKWLEQSKFVEETESANGRTPNTFAIFQNYPNPFNPETTIKYQITAPAVVTLKIYNLRGQKVRTLVNEVKPAGAYEVRWDGRDNFGHEVAAGIYVYHLQAGEYVKIKKMTLLR